VEEDVALRMRRRGVSTIIAELLLIVITVSIGTLVYSFASTAFGGFGAGFSNLVQNAGNQLAENVVVEQTYFINFNSTASCPVTSTCGDLFIRNVGSNTATISNAYLTNITLNAPINLGAAAQCPPNPIPPNPLLICYDTYAAGGYVSPFAGYQLPPGTSVLVRFNINAAVHPGTVYAFVLVTGRGNQFVAYEKR